MDLKILNTKDPGNKEKERVVLSVMADINLGDYLIAHSISLEEERVSSILEDIMWFPDQELKKGDQVVVYTKAGEQNKIANSDGSTSYFYYWNLPAPIGEDELASVIIFEADWIFQPVYSKSPKADEDIPNNEK